MYCVCIYVHVTYIQEVYVQGNFVYADSCMHIYIYIYIYIAGGINRRELTNTIKGCLSSSDRLMTGI